MLKFEPFDIPGRPSGSGEDFKYPKKIIEKFFEGAMKMNREGLNKPFVLGLLIPFVFDSTVSDCLPLEDLRALCATIARKRLKHPLRNKQGVKSA